MEQHVQSTGCREHVVDNRFKQKV